MCRLPTMPYRIMDPLSFQALLLGLKGTAAWLPIWISNLDYSRVYFASCHLWMHRRNHVQKPMFFLKVFLLSDVMKTVANSQYCFWALFHMYRDLFGLFKSCYHFFRMYIVQNKNVKHVASNSKWGSNFKSDFQFQHLIWLHSVFVDILENVSTFLELGLYTEAVWGAFA